MARVKVRTKDETSKALHKIRAGSIKSLGQAGAYIRGIARRSIKVSPTPSRPGKPPHTRKGRLKNAIVFAVEKAVQDVLIGPNISAVGKIGSSHEFGGTEPPKQSKARRTKLKLEVGGYGPIRSADGKVFVAKLHTDAQVARAQKIVAGLPPAQSGRGATMPRKYPARPFMAPALTISKTRLPAFWANSVKGG
jgi:hypothetical protein